MPPTPNAAADPPAPVLLVDDHPANLLALEAVLAAPDLDLVRASSGEEALARLAGREFAAVLMDLNMPGLDGFETARRVRADPRTQATPVLFVTADDARFPVVEAYRLGAVDYLVKPLVPDILRAKVAVFVDLFRKTRRLAAAERREADRRAGDWVRAVTDAVPALLAYVDNDLRFRFANRAFEDWFGVPPDRAVGQHVREVLGEDVFEHRRPHLEAALGGRDVRFEGPTRHRTLGERESEVAYTPHRDGGAVLGCFVLSQDVTDRRRAEAAARDREDRLRTLGDNLPDGFVYQVAADPGGGRRFTYLSAGVDRVFGVRPAEALADAGALYRLIHPDDAAGVAAAEAAALAAGVPFDREFRVRPRAGGERWVHCRSAPRRQADGSVVWDGLLTDATARKRAEAGLREADRRKDEFLAMLAHELRNPLAPLRNGLHVLATAGGGGPPPAGVLDLMGRQLGHLVRLVDDLLEASRVSRGKIALRPERVALADVVAAAVEMARPHAEAAGHALAVELPAGPVYLDADPARLTQALANLLNNACKFTDPGGRVAVRAGANGGWAEVRVADTGVGLDPALVPRLFEPFVQADQSLARSRGGLGLGLALVRRLVEMHGGTVAAHSAGPGSGSEFVVRLPAAASGPAPAPPPAPASVPGARRRVLIVEDHPDGAAALRGLLELAGHEVVGVADTGPAGLAAARALRPDVVVCDLGLPGMTGYELARALRAGPGTAGARLVSVSGYGRAEDRRRALEAGFDAALVKPVEPEELERAVAAGPEPVG